MTAVLPLQIWYLWAGPDHPSTCSYLDEGSRLISVSVVDRLIRAHVRLPDAPLTYSVLTRAHQPLYRLMVHPVHMHG